MTPELLKRLDAEIRAALPAVGGFGNISLTLFLRDGRIDRLTVSTEKSGLLREAGHDKH